jgi:hypothetical protein
VAGTEKGFKVVRVPSVLDTGTEPTLYLAATMPDGSLGFVQLILNEFTFVNVLGVAESAIGALGGPTTVNELVFPN